MEVVHLTDDKSVSDFLASRAVSRDLTILDFGATWCAPCRVQEKNLQAAIEVWPAEYVVAIIDVGVASATAVQYKVISLPTLIVLSAGVELARKVGTGGGVAGLQQFVASLASDKVLN